MDPNESKKRFIIDSLKICFQKNNPFTNNRFSRLKPKPSKPAKLFDVLNVLPVLVKKCLESGTVIMECKDGEYEPLTEEEILEL